MARPGYGQFAIRAACRGAATPTGCGLTPHAGLFLTGSSRTWHTGMPWRLDADAAVGIEEVRSEPAGGSAAHTLLLRVAVRW